MLSVYDSLAVKSMTLPSRFIRSATAERLPMENAGDGARLGAQYAGLARGGVGLIVSGHIAVHPSGRLTASMPLLDKPARVAAWRRAADETHAAGGLLAAQLNHGGGRARPPDGSEPFCVSPLPDRANDPMRGVPLDAGTIAELVNAFAAAARLAREAGMDAVQLHAAHGYLGSQFLSPAFNLRNDEWGGDPAGRARFLRLALRAVRAAVPADFPVGMKLGAVDDDPAGLTLEVALQTALWFQEDGLDFIEISGGFHGDAARRHVRPGAHEAYYLPLARCFKKILSIPVIAVGGFRSLAVIEDAIRSGACDAVSMSRPLIRQPDLPVALKRGEQSQCRGCNLCLLRNDRPTACHALRRAREAGSRRVPNKS